MNDFYQIFGVKPGAGGRHLWAECGQTETIQSLVSEARQQGYSNFLVNRFYLPSGDGQRRLVTTFVVP